MSGSSPPALVRQLVESGLSVGRDRRFRRLRAGNAYQARMGRGETHERALVREGNGGNVATIPLFRG